MGSSVGCGCTSTSTSTGTSTLTVGHQHPIADAGLEQFGSRLAQAADLREVFDRQLHESWVELTAGKFT